METLTDGIEDLVIGHGLTKRLNTFLLQCDDTVVCLVVGIRVVTGVACPLSDIPTFKVCTSRKNDIRKWNFSLKPDRLTDYEWKSLCTVHSCITVTLTHSSDMRATVFVQHLNTWIAICRILVFMELLFLGISDETTTPPFYMIIQNTFWKSHTVYMDTGCGT